MWARLALLCLCFKGFTTMLPSGLQSCCLGDNALLPSGKNALLPFGEECHANTRDNALLPSQLGSQHNLVLLPRGYSAWLLGGHPSLAPYIRTSNLDSKKDSTALKPSQDPEANIRNSKFFLIRNVSAGLMLFFCL